MKQSLFFLLFIFYSIILFAQKYIPAYKNFTFDEQNIKTCTFDKDADALMLFNVGESFYNDQYNLVTIHRLRFKILKENGIHRANIEIPYYSKDRFENIVDLKAAIFTPDNNGNSIIKDLENSATFKQKLNDRVTLLKFTLPNVKVGSIIEYQYTSTMDNFGGLQDWYFQTDMPTMISSYSLKMVPNAEFTYIVHKKSELPIRISNDKNTANTNFEMNDIPSLSYEPFTAASKDYLQRVEFQLASYLTRYGSKISYVNTWKQAAQELSGPYYFGRSIDKNLPQSGEIIAGANKLSNPYQKMNFIYEYVRDNFRWNGTDTKMVQDGLKDAWNKKTGTSGEINLILINLLKSAGLETYPLVVSERAHGKVTTQYPLLDQFNKVDAYVIINEKKYVLDATEIYTPANTIPFDVLNTNAFKVDNKNPEIIFLKDDKKSKRDFISLYAALNSKSVMHGEAVITSSDYSKISRVTSYKKDKENFKEEYFEKLNPLMKLDSFDFTYTTTDSISMVQAFKFSLPANTSGNYKMINYNLFTGLEKNPFISDNRFTNIDFGCKYLTSAHENFEIPSNLKPDELPKNTQLIMPDKSISFSRQISYDNNNSITVDLFFKIDKTVFTPEEYPYLKEYYKKLNDLLNEQILLTEK